MHCSPAATAPSPSSGLRCGRRGGCASADPCSCESRCRARQPAPACTSALAYLDRSSAALLMRRQSLCVIACLQHGNVDKNPSVFFGLLLSCVSCAMYPPMFHTMRGWTRRGCSRARPRRLTPPSARPLCTNPAPPIDATHCGLPSPAAAGPLLANVRRKGQACRGHDLHCPLTPWLALHPRAQTMTRTQQPQVYLCIRLLGMCYAPAQRTALAISGSRRAASRLPRLRRHALTPAHAARWPHPRPHDTHLLARSRLSALAQQPSDESCVWPSTHAASGGDRRHPCGFFALHMGEAGLGAGGAGCDLAASCLFGLPPASASKQHTAQHLTF
jgi:hypothetical protein